MTNTAQKPTWPGNAAKARIIRCLAQENRPVTVFDYGAGDGGHWPDILPLLPDVSLICFEPDGRSRAALERRLSGLDARTVATPDVVTADIIVSFSVLEHVFDRRAYLETARRALKPGGTFYLNYDDGHFRNAIELARPQFGPLREHLANLAAPIFPKVGLIGKYRRRVMRREADELIRRAGFTVVSDRYENVPSMKRLSKAMTGERMIEFMELWVGLEDQLNERFSFEARPAFGDPNVLWQVMGTRTLELR